MNLQHQDNSGFFDAQLTPLMKQYWDLKNQVPDSLLLFRMGDFYELFGHDARLGSQILGITLTSRDKTKQNPIPMAGVPCVSLNSAVQRILKASYKVAIAEQMAVTDANPFDVKLVERKIVRIFTPGVNFEESGSHQNFLATAVPMRKGQKTEYVLAVLDVATGDSAISDPSDLETICGHLAQLPVRHFLSLFGALTEQKNQFTGFLFETLPDNYLSLYQAKELLEKQFGVSDGTAFFASSSATIAYAVLVKYALRSVCQPRLENLKLPEPLVTPHHLVLGAHTFSHINGEELFGVINYTKSTFGSRLLKRWILQPFKNPEPIRTRQEQITGFHAVPASDRFALQTILADCADLERIFGKISAHLAGPKDTLALASSLWSVKDFPEKLLAHPSLHQLKEEFQEAFLQIHDLIFFLFRYQKKEAPQSAAEGGIFELGASAELDRYLLAEQTAQQWLENFEQKEKEKTQISNLKVRYHRVFGYTIEMSSQAAKNAPAHYQRRQTLVGSERFITEELKAFELEALSNGQKQRILEMELFADCLDKLKQKASFLRQIIGHLAFIDALMSGFHLSEKKGWVFPEVDTSLDCHFQECYHPILFEKDASALIPNHFEMTSGRIVLITGPNMGGKSTLMRQIACNVLLGQMGLCVCAQSARFGVFSSIFTRIGANDALMQGQSTFMVEMTQLAHILHHADERSLLILDEIGRGTSTTDGLAVAYATIEWISQHIRARTLFATHYHELTSMTQNIESVFLAHMSVDQQKDQLRFLYQLKAGPTAESFGIFVAQKAGLPGMLIELAQKTLHSFEHKAEAVVPSLTPYVEHPVVSFLKKMRSDSMMNMTPLQALHQLSELKEMADQ